MAETAETSKERREGSDRNRMVWFVIIGLIVILAVAGTLGQASSTSTVEPGMRAVVVPTADASRTIIVAPCGTGAAVLSSNPNAVMQTTGTTTLQLPQGEGERIVLVPKCGGGQGGSTGSSSLPSAAFLAPPGSGVPSIGSASQTSSPSAAAPDSAQFELTVADGSPIRDIVVSPCQRAQPSGPAEQILSASGNSSTAIAPAC